MKLADLGLKTKPATKYVAGGWVSFSTTNKELFYKTVSMGKTRKSTLLFCCLNSSNETHKRAGISERLDSLGQRWRMRSLC